MKGFVYILLCADGSFYTGSTNDLVRRLEEHLNGQGANHTRKRLPVELVYTEEYDRIDEAYYRERQIHGWSRDKKLALIEGRNEDLPGLVKSYWRKRKLTMLPSTRLFAKSTPFDTPSGYSGSGATINTISSQKHKTKPLKKENLSALHRGLSACFLSARLSKESSRSPVIEEAPFDTPIGCSGSGTSNNCFSSQKHQKHKCSKK